MVRGFKEVNLISLSSLRLSVIQYYVVSMTPSLNCGDKMDIAKYYKSLSRREMEQTDQGVKLK